MVKAFASFKRHPFQEEILYGILFGVKKFKSCLTIAIGAVNNLHRKRT